MSLLAGSRNSGPDTDTRVDSIVYPVSMGRPENGLFGHREHSAVLSASHTRYNGATSLESTTESSTGIHVPHNTIHKILREEDIASRQPKKSKRRKWIRYERTYQNSICILTINS